ncbi:MAG: hypothetical protein O4861_09005 [Trichodesmium sp. St16_bin4-tuft]|nr:hypothetical protein [Trichodesmium sp. MAG_R01]MDE5072915.1 hypothetical protein [Trichodesmium sp. St5_bin8]MDE5098463.1 hypothetical protein [Trichodesmium sp. St16_bin4-tuft]MDE5102689.1 hypothetical protein [Trichodesmium sp. St19_bin2]
MYCAHLASVAVPYRNGKRCVSSLPFSIQFISQLKKKKNPLGQEKESQLSQHSQNSVSSGAIAYLCPERFHANLNKIKMANFL